MNVRRLQKVDIPGPVGTLEGKLQLPPGPPAFCAVVSHPHPLRGGGGTMDNKVAYRMARALEGCGAAVLRYNFRGAGASEGVHDDGVGEQDDLKAAVRYLQQEGREALPLLLAGFSFGSVMSAKVALAGAEQAALMFVGAPRALYQLDALAELPVPICFVHGDQDEHGPMNELRAFHDSLRGPRELRVIEGAGHFFDEHQRELSETIAGLVTGFLATALELD